MSEEDIKVSNEPETAQTQKRGKDSWQKEIYT